MPDTNSILNNIIKTNLDKKKIKSFFKNITVRKKNKSKVCPDKNNFLITLSNA